jgi:hypothetical protein
MKPALSIKADDLRAHLAVRVPPQPEPTPPAPTAPEAEEQSGPSEFTLRCARAVISGEKT